MKITKEVVATRFRPKIKRKLEELAENKEMSVSELIRQIVENYLNLA